MFVDVMPQSYASGHSSDASICPTDMTNADKDSLIAMFARRGLRNILFDAVVWCKYLKMNEKIRDRTAICGSASIKLNIVKILIVDDIQPVLIRERSRG